MSVVTVTQMMTSCLLTSISRLDPLLYRLSQESGQVFVFSGNVSGGVEHVEGHVSQVGHQVDVALGPPTSCLVGEALVLGEPQQEKLEVVDGGNVADVAMACRLHQERIVSGQARSKGRLGHARSPQRKYAVAPAVAAIGLNLYASREIMLLSVNSKNPKHLALIRDREVDGL